MGIPHQLQTGTQRQQGTSPWRSPEVRPQWTLLQSDVHKLWNGTRFNKVPVELGEYDKVEVCVCAYALLIGLKPTTAQAALQRVRNNVPLASHVPTEGTTKQDLVERRSLHYTFLKKYVTTVLMMAHECNPAPGAAKDKQTVLTKRSWKDKWEDCCKYFKEQNPGPRRSEA